MNKLQTVLNNALCERVEIEDSREVKFFNGKDFVDVTKVTVNGEIYNINEESTDFKEFLKQTSDFRGLSNFEKFRKSFMPDYAYNNHPSVINQLQVSDNGLVLTVGTDDSSFSYHENFIGFNPLSVKDVASLDIKSTVLKLNYLYNLSDNVEKVQKFFNKNHENMLIVRPYRDFKNHETVSKEYPSVKSDKASNYYDKLAKATSSFIDQYNLTDTSLSDATNLNQIIITINNFDDKKEILNALK